MPCNPDRWEASLALGYAREGDRTVLVRRASRGPLAVQKPFYPEGPAVCHSVLLHPPGGIAGGDRLEIAATVDAGAKALLTTPGAAKWYRCDGADARQTIVLSVGRGAGLEWLPQETIVFDGARPAIDTRIELEQGARYLGWEILCFGRTAARETFARGRLRQTLELRFEGRLAFAEQLALTGGDEVFASPVGFAGQPVAGTFLLAGGDGTALSTRLREVPVPEGDHGGVTALPGLVVARYLGNSSQRAKGYFRALWEAARPGIIGRPACPPRIWST